MKSGVDVHPLSIGFMVGGPTKANAPWEVALLRLMNQVIAARHGVEAALNVNVVFQVPGSIQSPDFEGARTGTFSKKDRHLMVQVALPAAVPDDPDTYLRDSLAQAMGEVEQWNAKPNRCFELNPLHDILGRLGEPTA